MKEQVFTWFLFVILGFGCSKKETNTPNIDIAGNAGCVVANAIDSASNQKTFSCYYDENRRLTKLQFYTDGQRDIYNKLSYEPGKLTLQQYSNSGSKIDGPEIYSISQDGTLFGGTYSGFGISNNIVKDTFFFAYDNDKKWISLNRRSITFEKETNNIIVQWRREETRTYVGSKLMQKVERLSIRSNPTMPYSFDITNYEYFYDDASPTIKFNPVFGFLSTAYGILYGRLQADKIPVKEVKTWNSFDSSKRSITTTYTAIIDEKGNPTKVRSVESNDQGEILEIKTTMYTYNCP